MTATVEFTPPAPWRVGPVTRTHLVRYQGASGDMNPIHHDETFARAAGFDAPLSLGMWHAGLVGTFLSGWLGPDGVRRFRIRFQGQVFPGDELVVAVESADLSESDGQRWLDIEASCSVVDGPRAVTVWARWLADEIETAPRSHEEDR